MATSVAVVASQATSNPAERDARIERNPQRHSRGFAVTLVSALTLFAVAVDGYHPFADDGGLYVAGVKRLLDPTLFPHQTAFVLEPMRLSLFAPTVARLVRFLPMTPDHRLHTGLPVVLLALHLACIWVLLYAAWMLASRCWTTQAARAGAVALLACWLALPVAGTALLLMDPYTTARNFSTPAMVLALVGALDMTTRGDMSSGENISQRRRGFLLWAVSIVVAAAMHPLMAAYALGATLMLIAARAPKPSVRIWGTAALATASVALAACLQAAAKPESAQYLRAALTRTYWFPAEWRWYELLGLAAPLAILAIEASVAAAQSQPRPGAKPPVGPPTHPYDARPALAWMAVTSGATACVVAVFFARTATATDLVARMQPLRAFQAIYLVLAMMLGARLGERLLHRHVIRWGAVVLLLGGIMLATTRATFPDSNPLELPWVAPRNPWVQAFLWIRDNTPKTALFALDAHYIEAPGEDAQCFRAIAERSALPDYSKDGGEASIAPALAPAWAAGQAAQQGLSAPSTTDAERLAALRPLGVTWVVLNAGATTHLDCPFHNAAASVCRLR